MNNLPFNYQRDFRTMVEQSQDRTSPYYYKTQLIRFLNNDNTLTHREMLALMIGYSQDPHYKPMKDMQKEQEIFDMNEDGDYQGALTESLTYLKQHPLSLRILKECSYSYHQLYKKDSADYYMALVDKVMGAMIYSGKGKTIDKAIYSLGLNDGEWFIANIGMSVNGKNTMWDKKNNFLFIVNAMDDEGTYENWYFNITNARQRADDEGIDEETPMTKKKKKKKGNNKDDNAVDSKAKSKGWGGNKKSGKKATPKSIAPENPTDSTTSDSTIILKRDENTSTENGEPENQVNHTTGQETTAPATEKKED